MLANELKELLENANSLHRNRIRYNGTGPRLLGPPNKIWPRDSVDHQDESRKIIFSLKEFNISSSTEARIKHIIKYIFDGLRKCNIDNLFNKCCPLGPNHFGGISFEIKYALDAYTSYNQISDFLHSVIRSIDGIHRQRSGTNISYIIRIFGSYRNFEIFKKNLKWLVISNARVVEVRIDNFLSCGDKFMDLDQIDWLHGLEPKIKYKIYIQVLFALMRFIFELLRRYFYITMSNPYFDKLFYYRYDLWQKIYHAATKKLIEKNLLKELTLIPDVMNSLEHFAVSRLKYHLKRDDVRPICTGHRDTRTFLLNRKFEAILRHVLQGTANYRKFSLVYLLEGLRHFKELQEQSKTIFFVRADIKDCFPSIDQKLLVKIISNRLNLEFGDAGKVPLFKLICKRARDNKDVIQYCVDMNVFKRRGSKFSIERHFDESLSFEEFDQRYLRPCIIDPVLRESKFSKNGYLLQQGLRQGSTFSPILSSIYIQTAFNEELDEFLQSNSCRIYRYVDDILFMSTDIEESKRFMDKMLRGFRAYNITMNLQKLACNFGCQGLDSRLCRSTDHFIFYRQQICIKTLSCRYHFNHEFIQLLYSFRISPYVDRKAILKSIEKSRWDYIHLDERLNCIDIVIQNIFERASLLAHRAATMTIFSFFLYSNQDEELVVELVESTTMRVWKSITRGAECRLIINGLTHQQIKLIVAAAYEATWNLKRICHRAIERQRLKSYRERAMMRYLTYIPDSNDPDLNISLTQPLEFESRICNLIKGFSNSEFAKEVLIPAKDAKF